MLVYDKSYISVKNKYILPLSEYSVQYRSLNNINIKSILNSSFTSVEKVDDGYLFYFDEDTLLKAILGDINLFYVRHLIQKSDSIACNNFIFSANWNIVTLYYRAFFAASLLLRLCFRGNIFFDNDLRRRIENVVSQVIGEVIKLDSNQFYEVQYIENQYVLKLSKGIDNTHEIVWKKMDQLLDEFIMLARDKSEEKTVLLSLKNMNTKLTNTYPSKLRNRVNYQTNYGLSYLDGKLYPINSNVTWLNYLLQYDGEKDDNQIACCMYSYMMYIEKYCDNLIAEYFDIRGIESGVLKQYNKKYNEKKQIPKAQYVFDIYENK